MKLTEEQYGRVWRALAASEGHVQGVPRSIEYAPHVDLDREQVVSLLQEHRTIREAAAAAGATFHQFQSFMSHNCISALLVRRAIRRAAE